MAWPSVPTIAKQTTMSLRTVYTALAALDGLHLIRYGGGGRAPNRYRLVLWPVKPTSSTSEAGFISPVKDASPEPLNEPLIQPPNARKGGEEVNQEKRKPRENHSIIRKDRETIKKEVLDWARKHISFTETHTWETAPSAIREAFEQVHQIAPYPPAVREPRDIWRVDNWEKNGWDPNLCVGAVQGALVKKLEEGDPLASLKYVEQILKAQHRRWQGGHGAGG